MRKEIDKKYDKIKHVADAAKQVKLKSFEIETKNLLTNVELSDKLNESLEGDEEKLVFEN